MLVPRRNRIYSVASQSILVLMVSVMVTPDASAQPTAVPAPAPAPDPASDAGPASPVPPATGVSGAPSVPTPPADAVLPPVPAGPSPELAARLDEVEQLARIGARKHEILEEDAAKKAKEGATVGADDKGFSLRLPNNSFVLRIRGLVQADGRFSARDDALQANDTFLIRKFRPALEGTLFSIADFRLLPEFAGTPVILDAYIDLHPWEWARLRLGKFKAPIGLERLQSDSDRPFMEQALIQNLSSQRDVGAQLWGDIAGGIAHYSVGLFNGALDGSAADTDINHAKDVQGRLFFHPLRTESLRHLGNLGVGIGAGTGNRKGRLPSGTTAATTGLAAFRTSGQNTFFQYAAPATDTTGATTTFAHERATRLNPQLYYYYDSFGLLAEYLWLSQGVQRGNNTARLTHQSAAATVSFTINGRENYDGGTPNVGFDPEKGAWGALQLAIRASWLKVDDATFADPAVTGSVSYADPHRAARSAQAFGGAATWLLRRSVRLGISFEQTRFKGGAGATATTVVDRKTENVFVGRAQVAF